MKSGLLLYARNIDWKLLLFGVFACYFLPVFLIGTITANMSAPGAPLPQLPAMVAIVTLLTAPPIAAGYFAFRFAKQLPQLHALLIAAIGFAPYWFGPTSALFVFAVFLYSLTCVALGAFLWTRQARS